MKKITNQLINFASDLKNNGKVLAVLIGLNAIMAVLSNIVDWPWLMSVPRYVLPFTPICSLYPLTLAIWYSLYAAKKRIPAWYTSFVFMGIVSYGLMTWVYYPSYMAWDGIDLRLIGNMIWVTIYALQSLVIASELRFLPFWEYLLIFGYFGFKDYSDRFLGSFIDILRDDFPLQLKNTLFITILVFHLFAGSLIVLLPKRKSSHRLSGKLVE